MNRDPVSKDVVLLGGGHAHVIVIRKWAMQPIAGVRLTLISEQGMTPYSGMLPGLVAGHYEYRQSHIDLPRLCQWANVRFIEQRAMTIDPEKQLVALKDRPDIYYDILSIDTGGAPALHHVEGAAEFAVPVKPVSTFYERWQKIEQRFLQAGNHKRMEIGVVGAGAGGFEILLAMHHRATNVMKQESELSSSNLVPHRFHWIIRGEVLPGASARVRRIAIAECRKKGIVLDQDFDVSRVSADGITASDGRKVSLDEVLWCTEAQAADWPAQSGLACTESGFIRLNDQLQSVSHSNVFAAGDVAIQDNHPRPRAGVFAVRQGPVLHGNLQNAALGKPLRSHRPQTHFLTLLSLGHKGAIASKGMFSLAGDWVWRWKDHIDQTFMNRFYLLPTMNTGAEKLIPRVLAALSTPLRLAPPGEDSGIVMRCSGCGSKVPGDVLHQVLSEIATASRSDADDVSLLETDGNTIAQSVDLLRAMVDDPWIFARIATLHALSDLYASNVTPRSAMVIATLPFASDAILRSDLKQLMSGVALELQNAGCMLSGGHTTEGAELSLGLVVNGNAGTGGILKKGGMIAGQQLILTKPLGIGVLLAAHARGELQADDLTLVTRCMLLGNRLASEIALQHGATAMTDVTGFGLIGHLSEMMTASDLDCELNAESIPCLPAARQLAFDGNNSSLFSANARYDRYCSISSKAVLYDSYPLVFDPQTSGGLLFSLPAANVGKCLEALQSSGYDDASLIGEVTASVHPNLNNVPGGDEVCIHVV